MEMYLKLLLICGFVAASEPLGCIKRAEKTASMGMMGGWKKMDMNNADKEMSATVETLAKIALSLEERRSNDLYTNYQVTNRTNMKVYTQVVAGLNYCIQFEAKSTECGSGINKCPPRQRKCVAEVYQPPGSGLLLMGQPEGQDNFKVKCM